MDIFFTEEKLACRIDALAPWRMRDAIKAHGLRMMECPPEEVNPSPPPMDSGWTRLFWDRNGPDVTNIYG